MDTSPMSLYVYMIILYNPIRTLGNTHTVDGQKNNLYRHPSTKRKSTPQIAMLNKLYLASSAIRGCFFVHSTQAHSPKTSLKFGDAGSGAKTIQ